MIYLNITFNTLNLTLSVRRVMQIMPEIKSPFDVLCPYSVLLMSITVTYPYLTQERLLNVSLLDNLA